MLVTPVKTRILHPPHDDLPDALRSALPKLEERSVLAITSKVVSIWQSRCIPIADYPDKDELIKAEADFYLPRELAPNGWVIHTIKNNLFMPSAGIDESNADGHYILWPADPKGTAKKLWQWVRKTYGVSEIGVIITDSHCIPLRRGVVGISLSHYGFNPLYDYRKKKDLFGRELKITLKNFPDTLATAAVLAMGEGNEAMPMAVIRDVPGLTFADRPRTSRRPYSSLEIKTEEDLFYPLFSSVKWEKGGGGVAKKA